MKNNQGFTLIELLVVMSIITALSTVAFGYFIPARENARDTNIITTIRSLHLWFQGVKISTGSHVNDCGVTWCKICKSTTHAFWNWPPPNTSNLDVPFTKGIPYLRDYFGCVSYFDVDNNSSDGDPTGYSLQFYLYVANQENLTNKNKTLQSIFRIEGDPEDTPCEWADTTLAVCIAEYED